MFCLSLVFLAIVAAILVLWLDVPRIAEFSDFESELTAEFDKLLDQTAHGSATAPAEADLPRQRLKQLLNEPLETAFQSQAARYSDWLVRILGLIWLVIIAEQAAYLALADNWTQYRSHHPYALAVCLIPPLRLCAQHREAGGMIWFPGLGWQQATPALQRDLERRTSVPMIGIALLILPVLGLQMVYGSELAFHPKLRIALHIGTGLIWFAFAAEFLVMVSVTDKKLRYCKKHWLDIVIILLPLISFLRSWKLLRATKLIKYSKLQQLSKIIRVYRLRGVSMRALRALLVLEVIHRLLPRPERKLAKLRELYAEKEAELAMLRDEIDKLEQFRSASEKQPVVATDQTLAPTSPSK
jgi:hypothetical protein